MVTGGIARSVGAALAGLAALIAGVVALFVLFVGAICDPAAASCVSGIDYLAGTRSEGAALQLAAGAGFLALAAVVTRAASTGHLPSIVGATIAVAAFVVVERATIGALGLVPLFLLAGAVACLSVDRLRDGTPELEGGG